MRFPLGRLPLEAVLPLAERMSPTPRDVVADELRVSISVINRAFNPAEKYFVSFGDVPRLCAALHDDTLLNWARERYQYLTEQAGLDLCAHEAVDPQEALRCLAVLSRELGAVAGSIEAAVADGEIDGDETRRVLRALADLRRAMLDLVGRFDALRRRLDPTVEG
jgi:hypothetical protein